MKNIRCDAVVVQIIATEYDQMGRPIGEVSLPAAKLFRASSRDFWGFIDKTVEQARKNAAAQAAPPTPAPPAKVKGKRR